VPGAVPERRCGDQRRHAAEVLLDPHAADTRRDLRADRPAPVPRGPSRRDVAAVVEGGGGGGTARRPALVERQPLRAHARRAGRPLMATDRIVERRRVFQQYKEDVKERGKPFFPFAMWHDTVMSFVVVCVIVGLAIIWKFTTPGHHDTTQAGWLGKLYDEPAN